MIGHLIACGLLGLLIVSTVAFCTWFLGMVINHLFPTMLNPEGDDLPHPITAGLFGSFILFGAGTICVGIGMAVLGK